MSTTHNAYRSPAWRCPSCGQTCQCLAEHHDCRKLSLRYGHHRVRTDLPPVERRRFSGE